ncbi:hypothetical protein AX14_011062 [Amanita brunnescens Koide BX004]|nr:hypothetical protein AX14_011062 [Amanita brunnescens Koide BX004]
MSAPQDEHQALVDALQSMQATSYGILAAFAFLFYDVVFTMDREVNQEGRAKSPTSGGKGGLYVADPVPDLGSSREKWSFPKIAYVCVRYYGIIYLAATTIISLITTKSVET